MDEPTFKKLQELIDKEQTEDERFFFFEIVEAVWCGKEYARKLDAELVKIIELESGDQNDLPTNNVLKRLYSINKNKTLRSVLTDKNELSTHGLQFLKSYRKAIQLALRIIDKFPDQVPHKYAASQEERLRQRIKAEALKRNEVSR